MIPDTRFDAHQELIGSSAGQYTSFGEVWRAYFSRVLLPRLGAVVAQILEVTRQSHLGCHVDFAVFDDKDSSEQVLAHPLHL